ncbi:MAG: hypothetical protein QM691_10265 [Opitutaceae bacterium]
MSQEQSSKNILRRYPIALAAAGLVLALVAVTTVRFSALDDATAELEAKRSEALKAERNLRNAAGVERHVESVTKDVARLESMLVGVDDVSGNQAYFYKLESGTGVRIAVLRPTGVAKEAAKNASYAPAGFNVVVQGSYAQGLAFLRALEAGERLYRLSEFAVQRSSDQQSGGSQITLNLTLQLLARKP